MYYLGVFVDDNKIQNIILLSMWRGRVGFPDLRRRGVRLFLNYLDVGVGKAVKHAPLKVDICLVEAKATGDPLIYELRIAGIPAQPYIPKGDKESRVQRISHLIESGVEDAGEASFVRKIRIFCR